MTLWHWIVGSLTCGLFVDWRVYKSNLYHHTSGRSVEYNYGVIKLTRLFVIIFLWPFVILVLIAGMLSGCCKFVRDTINDRSKS